MFFVGSILGFQPDFGPSEIYRIWIHFGGVGWVGMGWVGRVLLDFEFRAAVFGRKLVFRRLWDTAGYIFMRPKAFPS